MNRHLSLRSGNPVLSKSTFKSNTLSGNTMTIDGTVNKTAISLFILVGCGYLSFNSVSTGLIIGCAILGFIIALVTVFKKEWSPITVPIYAAVEGVLLGGISFFV